MASKRDLVEAHDFNRRRLVTAFLSGAPGGREVEPVRYGRTIVGGLVLAGLLVAGAAVAGVLKPAVGDDWRENGLVIGKDSGSRFLVADGRLYPVANITSARLTIAEGFKVSYVPDDVLVKEPKYPAIGIVNAPDYLPPARQLVQTGWTACTNAEGGLRTVVDGTPGAEAATGEALVARSSTDKSYWIVTGGRRYPIPTGDNSVDVLLSLGLDRVEKFPATNDWLDLIATGSPVKAFSVPGSGDRTTTPVAGLDVVGTPVRVGDSGYVLGRKGLIPLSEFAYAVYVVSPDGARFPERTVEPGDLDGLPTIPDSGVSPADWPTQKPRPYTDDAPCLLLQRGGSATTTSRAVLATATTEVVAARGDATSVSVEQGRGALVFGTTRSTGDARDTTFLVDSLGTRYAVGPKNVRFDTQSRLGYGAIKPVPVPRAWVDLFRDGPLLSIADATKPIA